jgi:hypothetical protein
MANAFRTETFTHKGRQFEVSLFDDGDNAAPWENSDGHGPVRFIRDSEPLAKGETVLCDMARGRYVYNFGQALLIASRDKWGLAPDELARLTQTLGKKPSKGQIRAAAVRADMHYLRGWCCDDWGYAGVCVRIIGADGEPVGGEFDNALWGVETSGDYWREVACDLADDILHDRRKAWRNALTEARAARYWASRDVQTVWA